MYNKNGLYNVFTNTLLLYDEYFYLNKNKSNKHSAMIFIF